MRKTRTLQALTVASLVALAAGAAWAHGPGSRQGMMQGQGMMGPGMMGQGMAPGMMGPSMMGQGMGPGMMGQGMAPGMMGHHMGPGMMGHGFGGRVTPRMELDVDDVRHYFEDRLAWHGNKRLKLGEVSEKDDDTIVAQIVTQDGSLVDKLEVDRHSGIIRRVDE